MNTETEWLESNDAIDTIQTLFFNRIDTAPLQVVPANGGKHFFVRADVISVKDLWLKHRSGEETWGVYAYSENGMCKSLVLDLDFDEAVFESKRDQVKEVVRIVKGHLRLLGIPESAIRLVFSGRRGIHFWVFFESPVPFYEVQGFWAIFDASLPDLPLPVHRDYFPHRTNSPDNGKGIGYGVKLPLGFHKATRAFCPFVDDNLESIPAKEALLSISPWKFPLLIPIEKRAKTKGRSGPRADGKRIIAVDPAKVPQPPFDERIDRLFKKCAFMEGFKANPESTGFYPWSHAGLVLCQFGQAGEDWFTAISAKDSARFDGSHARLIQNVRRDGLCAPACKTIGCALCDFKSPLQAAYPGSERSRPVWIGEPEPKPVISVEEFRDELCGVLKHTVEQAKRKLYLVKAPMGAGKSRAMMEIIQEAGKKAMWWAPAYVQLEELEALLKVSHSRIEGLGRKIEKGMACPYFDEIRERQELGLPSEQPFCHGKSGQCEFKASCQYQGQFWRPEDVFFRLGVHASLKTSPVKLSRIYGDRDLVVFDECFLDHYRAEISISRENLQNLKAALGSANGMLIKRWINPLEALLSKREGEVVLPKINPPDHVFRSVARRFETDPDLGGKNILSALISAARQEAKIKPITEKGETRLWFSKTAFLPTDKPIFVLDGTANLDLYKAVLGPEFDIELIEPLGDRRIQQHVHVSQVLNGAYPNASLIGKDGKLSSTGQKILKFVREHINEGDSAGIIPTKKVEDLLTVDLGIEHIAYGHFNNVRGLNNMERKNATFTIGYQGVDWKELAKEARIKCDLNWNDEEKAASINPQKSWRRLDFNKGGIGWETQTFSFDDPHLQLIYEMKCISEVDQAVNRARVYSNDVQGRRLFIMTNIPTSLEIDEVLDLNESQTPETVQRLISSAFTLLNGQGSFSRDDLERESGIPRSTIHHHMERIILTLRLEEFEDVKSGKLFYRRSSSELGVEALSVTPAKSLSCVSF